MFKMSDNFFNILMKSSTASIDEKIKKLSMVLDKIMEVAIKSISGIENQVQTFDAILAEIRNKIEGLEANLTVLEQKQEAMAKSSIGSSTTLETPMPSQSSRPVETKPINKPLAPPVSASTPKPTRPINPRAELQSELKALFSKMKR